MTWKQGYPNASVYIQYMLIKFKLDSLTKININTLSVSICS